MEAKSDGDALCAGGRAPSGGRSGQHGCDVQLARGCGTQDAHGHAMSRRAFARVLGAGVLATLTPMLGGCKAYQSAVTGKRTVVDDAGRELQIPTAAELERVYFTSTLAQIFCFTLNSDMLGGTGFKFTPEELEYLPTGTDELPYLGTLSGDGEIDREQLLVEDVQLVFSISGINLTEANISDAEDLQKQLNVPVVCLDGSFENIANCYRVLGDSCAGARLARTGPCARGPSPRAPTP